MYRVHISGGVMLDETTDGVMVTFEEQVFLAHRVTAEVDDGVTTFHCLVNYVVVSQLLEGGCDFTYSKAFSIQ